MKKSVITYVIFNIILVLFYSCSSPINELSMFLDTESQKTKIFETVSFFYNPSDDKTCPELNDALKNTSFFKLDGEKIYFCDDYSYYIFNDSKGIFISPCIDPICTHKTNECPYFTENVGSNNFFVKNGYFYFLQSQTSIPDPNRSSKHISRYVKVNTKTNDVETRGEYERTSLGFISELYTDKFHYYFKLNMDEAEDKLYVALMRQNIQTMKIETIDEFIGNKYTLVSYHEGKIFWYNLLTHEMFASDEDMKNPEFIFSEKGVSVPIYSNGQIIYVSNFDINSKYQNLSVYDLKLKQNRKLADIADNAFIATDKYIYYIAEQKVLNSENENMMIKDNVIWRVDRKSGKQNKVFCLSDIAPTCAISEFFVSGNFLYAIYWQPNAENTNMIASSNQEIRELLRVDVNNGEMCIIDLPEY